MDDQIVMALRECADKLSVLVIYGKHDAAEKVAAQYAIDCATAALAALNLPARDAANVAKGLEMAVTHHPEQISDADAIEIWRAIEQLTDGEGDTVTVLCANPDFNGQPNYAIICNGFWTDWQDHRFADDSQVECFRLAARALTQLEPETRNGTQYLLSRNPEVTQETSQSIAKGNIPGN